ncbi:hypothetical protein EG68_12634 [Paragonimus skrjabini miyazakii]|uniref:isocitrate dehydrogenase (NAD(+)) n=1 Tax=Paragonimus skrjabini miyazakii TaxID=59628 RepID=A0A8S9YC27_9TREM|nr:hypothetical protein EG68_12634 [Paragonimus skrjabini miyazakii]
MDKANPTALLLSAVMMLRYMDLHKFADLIEKSVFTVIREGHCIGPDVLLGVGLFTLINLCSKEFMVC